MRRNLITNFVGGVNIHDDIQSISDNQLNKSSNTIITRDGSIQNRFGIHHLDNTDSITGAKNYRVLGSYGNTLIISTENSGVNGPTIKVLACSMDHFDPTARAFVNAGANPDAGLYNTSIPVGTTTEGRILAALPYVDSLLLVHENGFIRSIVYTGGDNLVYPGSSTTGTVPGVPKILNPNTITIWKDRLFFAAEDGKIYYSSATDPLNFATPDGGYFTVGNEPTNVLLSDNYISSILVFGDVMYIFKDKAIYAFTFQTDPGTDGYLRALNKNSGGQQVVVWNSRIFVGNSLGVYEFNNGNLYTISTNMDQYVKGNNDCTALFVFEDYLIARYNGDYICMNLLNGAWTHWNSSVLISPNVSFSVQSGPANSHNVVFGSSNQSYAIAYMSTKAPKYDTTTVGTAGGAEEVGTPGTASLAPISFVTKMFTFDSPWTIKKIHKIMVDRGSSYSASPAPTLKGFRVYFYTADGVEHLLDYPVGDNRFGRLVLGGAFRCYHFKIHYDFGYTGTPAASFDLNINSLAIDFTSGSEYPLSDGTFNK